MSLRATMATPRPGSGPPGVTNPKRKALNNDFADHITIIPSSNSNKRQRSSLPPVEDEEKWQMKTQGACLRCRTMRRTCSQGDPCKTCLSAADKSAQRRALKWMECIRTTLNEVNIYRVDPSNPPKKQFEKLFRNPDRPIYSLDVDASILAEWLSEGGSSARPFQKSLVWKYYFVIFDIALQHQRDNLPMENIFNHFLGRSLGVDFHSIKQVDPSILKAMACHVLDMVDNFVKPSHLETFKRHRQRLMELFVVVWILYLAAVQDLELQRRQKMSINASQAMGEALVRLLWHYLIYLGNASSLIETGDDGRLWQARDTSCRKFILEHVLALHLHDAGSTAEATTNAEETTRAVCSGTITSSRSQDSLALTRSKAIEQDSAVNQVSVTDPDTSSTAVVTRAQSNARQCHGLAKTYFCRLLDAHRGKSSAEPKLMSLIEDYLEIPRAPTDRLSQLTTYWLQMKYRFEETNVDHQIVPIASSPPARKRIRALAPAPAWSGQQRFSATDTAPWSTQMTDSTYLQRSAIPQYQRLEDEGVSRNLVQARPDMSFPTQASTSSGQFTDLMPYPMYSYISPHNADIPTSHVFPTEPSSTLVPNQVLENPQSQDPSFQTWHAIPTSTEKYCPEFDSSANFGDLQDHAVPAYNYLVPEQKRY